jgi:hypothetical protein
VERFIAAILIFGCAPILTAQGKRAITSYTTEAVGLRAAPGGNATVVAQLGGDTRVETVACDSTWWCEISHDGVRGYLPKISLYTLRISSSGIQEPTGAQGSATIPPELQRALITTKTDLRKLITSEEMFFADSVRYTTSLGELPRPPEPWSPEFTATIELLAGSDGWRATATNNAAPGWTCGIWIGFVPAYLPYQKEAVPRCWKER